MLKDKVVDIVNLQSKFGDTWVHRDVNLSVRKGEVVTLMGGSGTGKTTILRCLLMLQMPYRGDIKLFGDSIFSSNDVAVSNLRDKVGILYQSGALFSGLTVLENILFPLKQNTNLPHNLCVDLAMMKLSLVGLSSNDASKMPSELSGGMKKRAAAARAIALDPELLLLDEPTSGLDPNSARQFDTLLLSLRESLNLSILMVSHDLVSIEHISDSVAFLAEGKVLAQTSYHELKGLSNPWIQRYFAQTY